jgi:phosphatidylinositol phospholipase C delta
MAALNIQSSDEGLFVNDGRFRENGGVGYVLKPSILMMKDEHDPRSTHLEIKILSGSCLPKPKGLSFGECIDPYVKISLFDCHEGKEVNLSQTTNVLLQNGFSPIWNFEDSFHLDVKNTSVAVMQFSVWNKNSLPKDDEIIASASVPISCMRQGIRSVQLFDENMTRSGAFAFASLLVLVKFKHSQAEI